MELDDESIIRAFPSENPTMSSATDQTAAREFHSYVAGRQVVTDNKLTVSNPFNGEVVGRVAQATAEHTDLSIAAALKGGEPLTRYQRYEILATARGLLSGRAEEFARLISAESGLCIRETRYEVERATDVLLFAAMEALKDDGEVFSGDISAGGKARKIFTMREPLALVSAITPFNHPLNQVVHKLAPAIAAGASVLLKPSGKTPLTAIRCAELLYEAGLPGWMLSVLIGAHVDVADIMVRDPRVELVTFTGSVGVGKQIAETAGYKKLVLELGGNSPLLILEDADMELAVHLAAEGCFRNSGQRCTAVKRLLVHEEIVEEFTDRFVERAREYVAGDPSDAETRVGTVIDEQAAIRLQNVVRAAVADGARVLLGGERHGALLPPTILANVSRSAEMVVNESFGPLAPIIKVQDIDDAIEVANSTAYGLAAAVVTNRIDYARQAIKGIRTGTVHINEVPGYRIECSPFGGVKESGIGIKEGVIEAIKSMTIVKTFSLPW